MRLRNRITPRVPFLFTAGAALALCAGGATPARGQMQMQHPMSMNEGPLGIAETRLGSGTSWLPEASQMHATHLALGRWTVMVHGSAFLMYDWQSGPADTAQFGGARGGTQAALLDWLMFAASRPFLGGQLHLRTMFSTDPFEISGAGYPELLQTGEFYKGVHIHDRQHQHNLFMELAALYERPLVANKVGLSLYIAPAGEPAVGPVAFMHRPSAQNDPFAPISHHWQDATHITFGVATAGLCTRAVKLEASSFNGREPDQHRTHLEFRDVFDSYSARLTINPGARWSLSSWYGYFSRPEAGFLPNMRRYGASILATLPHGQNGQWASALIWGANAPITYERGSSSVLLESNLDLDDLNAIFGRVEYVRKQAHDILPLTGVPAKILYDLWVVALGVRRVVVNAAWLNVGVGVRAAANIVPPSLESWYGGSRVLPGGAVYLTLQPRTLPMGGMMDMPGMSH